MADHSIQGKVVLSAGGAKNLGGCIARDLAERGADHRGRALFGITMPLASALWRWPRR